MAPPNIKTCNSTETYCYARLIGFFKNYIKIKNLFFFFKKSFKGSPYYAESDYSGGMTYSGGCAVNCKAGSHTSDDTITITNGITCCKTSLCNSSDNVKATKTLVLVVIMVMSIFGI